MSRHDTQLLFDTNLRLRVSDTVTVMTALDTVLSRILPNFPAEVILQRVELFNVRGGELMMSMGVWFHVPS